MNLRQMELVLKTAELKSFTKAANELKVPQPSLSQSILNLEKEIGMPLFNRTTNPVSLTHAGEIYCQKARLVFDILNDLNLELSEMGGAKSGKIRIGFSQNGYIMTPDVLPKFCKKFNKASIKILQVFSTLKIRKMLIDDEIDLGMLILPIDTEGLKYEIIKTQEMFLALPILHPLSQKYKGQKNPKISLKDVKDEKFILPKQNQRSRILFDEIFKRANIKPEILCETETFDIANSIVASGVGACFTIPEFIKEDKKDKITLFDINEPSLNKTLILAYKEDKKPSNLMLEFIKMAKEC
ncbi:MULTISPECIES: LysR family transcriptional regulator [Campylobacter]|uniref:LysR family transcriptional regulator n=1 Tax=Campylobacter TaxID=194 RepID=UPI001475370E|nr:MULTISPECIES: LysR family transcriptional regulator [unclassified Campylobacter]MBE3022793.1 LysR family transcriptional regulator [Campylobacter sp. 7477a]MBE3609893.1 LysR family transcriptional regulator [Campylobacter sp. RM12916]